MPGRALITAALVAAIIAGCVTNPAPSPRPTPEAEASPVATAATAAPSTLPAPTATPAATPQATLGPGGDIRFDVEVARPLRMASLGSIVGSDTGFLLTGWEDESFEGPFFRVAGSADGSTWQSSTTVDPSLYFTEVVHGTRGWVARRDVRANGTGIQLLFSEDGARWDLVDGPSAFATATAFGLTAGSEGFVLNGQLDKSGDYAPRLWFSSDGRTWHKSAQRSENALDEVVALQGAFLGTGWDGNWISRSGANWTRLSNGRISPFSEWASTSIATSRDGTLLALTDARPDGDLGLWRGSLKWNGDQPRMTWQRLPELEKMTTGVTFTTAVAAPAHGFLLLGFDSKFRPLAFTSADGAAWIRSELAATAFDGGVPASVVSSGSGYVAVGWNVNSAGAATPDLWRSQDGVRWEPTGPGVFGDPPAPLTGPCPEDPMRLVRSWQDISPEILPGCYGTAEIELTGYVAGCGGCGGTAPVWSTVEWLLSSFGGYADFWLVPSRHRSWDYPGFDKGVPVHLAPGLPRKIDNRLGAKVKVVGHFNDPASARCRIVPAFGVFGDLQPSSMFIPLCLQTFVVTKVTIVDP